MVIGAINIANKVNQYFTNIGPQLPESIDASNKIPFHSYLTEPCPSSFGFQYKNPTDVSKIINKIKPKSSAGYDNISLKLFIQIGDIIACPLSIIINQSLCTGIFPKKPKLAKVIPLYKKCDEKSFGNYRPISLLSSFSKIFDRIVFNQLYDYLIEHDILYQSQYGFRRFHSTELAALELIDRIRQKIGQKKVPFLVFLDLSKAFDTLNHDILLTKLYYYDTKGMSLSWFTSYLENRYQYVEQNGTSSSLKEIETGVPQGSILGLLLFITYMNDIHWASKFFSYILTILH